MTEKPPTKPSNSSRRGVKSLLAALAVAGTLSGWAVISASDRQAQSITNSTVVEATAAPEPATAAVSTTAPSLREVQAPKANQAAQPAQRRTRPAPATTTRSSR